MKAIQGYEGSYAVTVDGSVHSLPRRVLGRDGVSYPVSGRVLKPAPNKDVGYLEVSLWKNGEGTSFYVHRLVAQAFIPNPLGLPEVNHKDGNRHNNAVSNLEWVTSSENSHHAVATGLRIYENRIPKEDFIECLYAVIEGASYASLTANVPYKVPYLSTKIRQLARELDLEKELNQSLYLQRVERAKSNGSCNK